MPDRGISEPNITKREFRMMNQALFNLKQTPANLKDWHTEQGSLDEETKKQMIDKEELRRYGHEHERMYETMNLKRKNWIYEGDMQKWREGMTS